MWRYCFFVPLGCAVKNAKHALVGVDFSRFND